MAAEIPNNIKPDVLICEATYGVLIHASREECEMRFTRTIERVVSRGGRYFIPVFDLSDSFNVFNVFIVYTYTEESEEMGQSLLNSSSKRSVWFINTIIFLYHGEKDIKIFWIGCEVKMIPFISINEIDLKTLSTKWITSGLGTA